jgi:CRP-like cAMP-binding protein
MSEAEVARLREAASEALKRGQHPLALRHCLDLEKLEPNDPRWPRRTALVLNRMNRTLDEIDALDRSAAKYEQAGDPLKCATVCNQILQLDPNHQTTRERLLRIHRKLQPKAATPKPAWSAPDEAWVSQSSSGLARVELRRVALARPATTRAGMYHIPLSDEDDSRPLELSAESDVPLHLAAGLELTLDAGGNVTSRAAEQVRAEVFGAPPPKVDVLSEDDAIRAVEAELLQAAQTNAALTATPLFAELSEKSFSELLMHARPIALEKNQEVFHQGERGDALFVIAEGSVGVIDEGPPRRGINKLVEGDFFGEIALLSDRPRSATCIALEETQLIRIDREVMTKLIATDPEVLPVMLRFFRDRSVERLLSTNPLFTVLSEVDREAVKKRFRFLEVEAGAVMLSEGRQSEGLLLLLAGHANVVRQQGGRAVTLGTLGPGDLAGEMSLLTESPAVASVVAAERCFVIELPAAMFLKIVKSRPKAMEFIQRVIERRAGQGRAILAGDAGSYRQGKVDLF